MEKLVLFDMDGTIYDTSPGIVNSYKHIMLKFGLIEHDDDGIREFIGQNLFESIKSNFKIDDKLAKVALMEYRGRYKEHGVVELTPYTALNEILVKLKNKGFKLGVATLKGESLAIDICKRQGTYELFDVIRGMDASESLSKSMIIDECIKELDAQRDTTIMVGDSKGDMVGASQSKVDFIPVLYGYGLKKDEHKDYDTLKPCNDLNEVYKVIIERLG